MRSKLLKIFEYLLGSAMKIRNLNLVVRPGVVLGRTGGMVQQIFPPFYLGLGGRYCSGCDPLYNCNSIYFMLIIQFNTIPVKDGIRRAADALDPCEGRHLSPDHG